MQCFIATNAVAQKNILCVNNGGGGGGGIPPPPTLTDTPAVKGAFCYGGPLNFHTVFPMPSGGGNSSIATTHYGVDTIQFANYTFTGTPLNIIATNWSNVIPLPFPFCYFGQTYDSIVVSPFGEVSFNKTLANTLASNFINPSIGLPNPIYTSNTIFSFFQNLDYAKAGVGKLIQYDTIGIAPCRKFIISFENIPFADTLCNGQVATFQIILYETNLIDLQIANVPACSATNSSILGMQNNAADSAFAVPNFNVGNDTLTSSAWRFYPDATDTISYLAILFDNAVAADSVVPIFSGGDLIADFLGDSIKYPPNTHVFNVVLQTFHSAMPCSGSGGGGGVGSPSITLHKPTPFIVNIAFVFSCLCANNPFYPGSDVFITSSLPSNIASINWSLGGSGSGTNYCCNPIQTSLINLSGGVTSVSVLVTDSNGCEATSGAQRLLVGPYTFTLDSIIPATCLNGGWGEIYVHYQHINYSGGPYLPPGFNWAFHPTNQNQIYMVNHPGTYNGILQYCSNYYNSNSYVCSDNFGPYIIPDLRISSSHSQSVTLCVGAVLHIGYHFYSTAGIYMDTLVNYHGCDSVITSTVFVAQPSSFTQSVGICNGTAYNIGSHSHTSAGIYKDTIPNFHGCDSVVTTTISIKQNSSLALNKSICIGDAEIIGIHVHTATGNYSDTLTNAVGCDSIVNLQLLVKPVSATSLTSSICEGSTFNVGNSNYTQAGNYVDTLLNFVGCDSIVTTNLTVREVGVALQAIPDTLVNIGDAITLVATMLHATDSVIIWKPNDNFKTISPTSIEVKPETNSTWYYVTTSTTEGCTATDSILIILIDLALPNAFTPNGDGQNDIYIARGKAVNAITEFSIYNRWGERVFYTTDYTQGWDGKYKNQPEGLGTYSYILKANLSNGKQKTLKGNFELLR